MPDRGQRPAFGDTQRVEDARIAAIFAALGDATRLRLMAQLSASGPQSIARLTDGSAISRQAVAKHLLALKAAGLASNTRAGREQLWDVEAQGLTLAQRHLALISSQWDAAARRLRAYVESDRD